jgi:hypothetical protein
MEMRRFSTSSCLGFCAISSVLALIIISKNASGEPLPAEAKQTACLYDVNLDLLYLSEAKGFSTDRGMVARNAASLLGSQKSAQVRTLGLRKSVFNFEWSLPRGVAVQISLRPDATGGNGDTFVRELDIRSGRTIEPMPSIHLLDEFRFIVKKPALEVHLGVEDTVLETVRVTPELLGFGLWVRGPEKSLAAGFSAPKLINIGNQNSSDAVGFGINIISGRDERHDRRVDESSGLGESPSKRDPYWGGSAKIGLDILDGSKAVVSAAISEEREEGATAKLQWYQAGMRRSLESANLLIAMEVRQFRESYKHESTEISDVSMTSVGVTSSFAVDPIHSLLIGFWSGAGEIHPLGSTARSLAVKGAQAEIGWQWHVEKQLDLVACGSREWRRDNSDLGGSTGGFSSGDGKRSSQSRIAIQLNYKVGGQI